MAGEVKQVAVLNGTSVVYAGEELLSADVEGSYRAALTDAGLTLHAAAPLKADALPTTVVVFGAEVQLEPGAETVTVDL